MFRRVVVGAGVVLLLTLLILYSQWRDVTPFVSGIIETDEIRVGSRVGGRVQAVLVKEGDQVAAGQALLQFEPFDLLERENQARAELAAREAELRRVSAGLRAEEIQQSKARLDQLSALVRLLEAGPRDEEVQAAKGRLRSAEALLLLARQEYDRREKIFKTNAVSREEMDAASQKLDAATADVDVKKSELAILEAGSRAEEIEQARARAEEARLAWELAKQGSRQEDIDMAQSAKEASQAALEAIGQQRSELTIKAPSDGYIDALDIQPGDLVGPNAPVLSILSDQRLWVRAYVPQRFLHVSVGQEVNVTVDSWPTETFSGVVSYISHQAEFMPSNVQTSDERAKQVYRIRVVLEDHTQKLRAGMTANVWLPVQVEP